MHNSDIVPETKLPATRNYGRLVLRSLDDIHEIPPRTYLLAGVLARGELSVVWGEPKSGKSFLALRLAYGIACGKGMFGREASRARVLYVAGEGSAGLSERLKALRQTLGNDGGNFCYLTQPIDINPAHDLQYIVNIVRENKISLIVVDTLARNFGDGDENSARDMGRFIHNIDIIRETTGAHVLIIHHATKEGGTARGSGALAGAADIVMKVTKATKCNPYKFSIVNAKDDPDGEDFYFYLKIVKIGSSDRNTCVAQECEAHEQPSVTPTRQEDLAFDALKKIARVNSDDPTNLPPSILNNGVQLVLWKIACSNIPLAAGTDEAAAKAFVRAKTKLHKEGRIEIRDDLVFIKSL